MTAAEFPERHYSSFLYQITHRPHTPTHQGPNVLIYILSYSYGTDVKGS